MADLDLYRETILEEAAHPANRGVLARYDRKARYGNASCGDHFMVYLVLDEAEQKIAHMSWDGEGCAISTAAISLLSERVVGQTLAEVKKLTYQDIGRWLGLDAISPGRIGCVATGLRAVHQALAAGDATSR